MGGLMFCAADPQDMGEMAVLLTHNLAEGTRASLILLDRVGWAPAVESLVRMSLSVLVANAEVRPHASGRRPSLVARG